MTPEERARIKSFLAKISLAAEDFQTVFYGRLMAQAPELRIHYLPALCNARLGLSSGIEALAECAAKPAELEKVLSEDRILSGASSARVQDLNFRCFLWAAERCFGEEFSAEDRAAFDTLHRAIMGALHRLYRSPDAQECLERSV